MDIPDLVEQALDDEDIQAGVSLGDEDAVCRTPTRTLVYKGDGLLSDEQLEAFPHDLERIAVSEGHRKTKFTLEYFDGTRSFTVPPNRDEKVLQLLLEGVLRADSVIEDRESVVDVYRFSELTLIVADGRLIKLVGAQVWNDDYEVYPFADVTGLDFERASVATSVVVEIDGRPQRVKVPNDTAPLVRQTIEQALFAYYNVASLEELNGVVDDGSGASDRADHDEIDLGEGIDPLVTDHGEELAEPEGTLEDISAGGEPRTSPPGAEADDGGATVADQSDEAAREAADQATDSATESAPTGSRDRAASESGSGDTVEADRQAEPSEPEGAMDSPHGTTSVTATEGGATDSTASGSADSAPASERADQTAEPGSAGESDATAGDPQVEAEEREAASSPVDAAAGSDSQSAGADEAVKPAGEEDMAAVADRLDALTDAVDRQNELLKRQHRAIKQLVDHLQSE